MGAGAMVALAVILPRQLPISLLYDGRLVGDLGVLQAVRHHVGRDAGLHRREVRRDGRETDEDVAGDRLAVHRLQPVGRGIEGWAHVARGAQTALEVIGPLVVWKEIGRAACRERGGEYVEVVGEAVTIN